MFRILNMQIMQIMNLVASFLLLIGMDHITIIRRMVT